MDASGKGGQYLLELCLAQTTIYGTGVVLCTEVGGAKG